VGNQVDATADSPVHIGDDGRPDHCQGRGHCEPVFLTGSEQKQLVHWRVAIRMFGHAVKESACLRVATISLKNAPSYEGTLNAARSPDPA